jgi:hypothetical protein
MKNPNSATGLQGRWVSIPNREYYHIGQVTLSFGHYHLNQESGPPNRAPPWSRLVTSDELCTDETFIFDSEDEMAAWLKWLETPDDGGQPRVVAMRKE